MKKIITGLLLALGLYGQQVQNFTYGLIEQPLPVVSGVGASYSGTVGATTYYYVVIAKYGIGNANPSIAMAVPKLGTGTVTISWPVPPNLGALNYNISYDVIRLTSPNFPANGSCTNCLVASATTSLSATDTLGSKSSYSLSTYATGTDLITINNRKTDQTRIYDISPSGVMFSMETIVGAILPTYCVTTDTWVTSGDNLLHYCAPDNTWNTVGSGGGTGTVLDVTGTTPIVIGGTPTIHPVVTCPTCFSILTTTGSGAATVVGHTLNIPTPTAIELQTNGVDNTSQTLLNLVAGTNVTLTNVGGAVTIDATGGGGSGCTVVGGNFAIQTDYSSACFGNQSFVRAQVALPVPTAPVVTTSGTTGATNYCYTVVPGSNTGFGVPAASPTCITNGNATLNGSNFNIITTSAVVGSTYCSIWRTTGGSTLGRIDSGATACGGNLHDTGIASKTFGNVIPTTDNSLGVYWTNSNSTYPGGFMFSGAAFSIGGSNVISPPYAEGNGYGSFAIGFNNTLSYNTGGSFIIGGRADSPSNGNLIGGLVAISNILIGVSGNSINSPTNGDFNVLVGNNFNEIGDSSSRVGSSDIFGNNSNIIKGSSEASDIFGNSGNLIDGASTSSIYGNQNNSITGGNENLIVGQDANTMSSQNDSSIFGNVSNSISGVGNDNDIFGNTGNIINVTNGVRNSIYGNTDGTISGTNVIDAAIYGEYATVSATGAYIIGRGASNALKLANSTANTMCIGINTDTCSLIIGDGGNTAGGLSSINAVGPFQTVKLVSTSLPACSIGGTPWRASVTDATAPILGVDLTGGGAVFANVHCSLTTGNYIVDGL